MTRRILVLALPARCGSVFSTLDGIALANKQNENQREDMKKFIGPASIALSAMLFLSGCVAAIGNRGTDRGGNTLGQQLIDLQKARDSGAMTEAEYQTQKSMLLNNR